jgi:hypothetical protein
VPQRARRRRRRGIHLHGPDRCFCRDTTARSQNCWLRNKDWQ